MLQDASAVFKFDETNKRKRDVLVKITWNDRNSVHFTRKKKIVGGG
jgi:hypothetical protein